MAVPTVLWAQRKKSLFITIDVQDATNHKVEVVDDADKKTSTLKFSADAHSAGVAQDDAKKGFSLDLPLFAAVDRDASKVSVTSRQVYLVLEKAEEGGWPRLTQEKGRHLTHIRCDWDRWVDSDDEDALADGGGGDDGGFGAPPGMDFSSLAGMGGMGGGGMGGMGGLEGLLGGMGGGGGMGGMANLASMMGGGGGGGGGFGDMGGGAGGLPDFGAGGLEGDEEDDEEGDDMPPLEEEGADAGGAKEGEAK